ncbi:hypothetical protein AAG906_033336 [Vitis piasezkii]
MILKRTGKECGDFVAVDDRTKTMGEIQWARLLVKTRGDFRTSVLEIKVEEDVYVMSLWWEIRPVVRMKYSEAFGRRSDEVRGDVSSCAEKRGKRCGIRRRIGRAENWETESWPGDPGMGPHRWAAFGSSH